ncbi:MAG: hypothetical protein RL092_680 [Bacteroidota bacterium]|jgi:nicotinamide riboside kinase
MSIRIAFTGPESSGKSTFAEWVSKRLSNAAFIPEYARIFLESEKKQRANKEDFMHIVEMSLAQYGADFDHDYVIFDGDQSMLEVWSEWEFQIEMPLSNSAIQLVFLCYPDIPWEMDPLRSLPRVEDRLLVFTQIEKKLKASSDNYVVLKGSREQKEAMIIASINAFQK